MKTATLHKILWWYCVNCNAYSPLPIRPAEAGEECDYKDHAPNEHWWKELHKDCDKREIERLSAISP